MNFDYQPFTRMFQSLYKNSNYVYQVAYFIDIGEDELLEKQLVIHNQDELSEEQIAEQVNKVYEYEVERTDHKLYMLTDIFLLNAYKR